jgi:hypothetical protein
MKTPFQLGPYRIGVSLRNGRFLTVSLVVNGPQPLNLIRIKEEHMPLLKTDTFYTDRFVKQNGGTEGYSVKVYPREPGHLSAELAGL